MTTASGVCRHRVRREKGWEGELLDIAPCAGVAEFED
jgi:hypothetical protein